MPPGRTTVLADGGSRFDESEGGVHRYLILSEEQKAELSEKKESIFVRLRPDGSS